MLTVRLSCSVSGGLNTSAAAWAGASPALRTVRSSSAAADKARLRHADPALIRSPAGDSQAAGKPRIDRKTGTIPWDLQPADVVTFGHHPERLVAWNKIDPEPAQ